MEEEEQAEVLDQEVETTEEQAPQEETQEEVETEAPPELSEAEKADKKRNDAVQKRFNAITKEKYGLKERAEQAEAKLARLTVNQNVEPKIEDFDYDQDAFIEKTVDYRVQQGTAAAFAQQQQNKLNTERQKQGLEYSKKVEALAIPDFAEVSGQLKAVNPSIEMIDAIISDQNGPQLAYYLGKNLDKADEIKNSNPYQAGKLLAELSSKLANTKPKKKLTTAPDPPPTLKSGGSVKKDYSAMSMDEIMAASP